MRQGKSEVGGDSGWGRNEVGGGLRWGRGSLEAWKVKSVLEVQV